MEDYIKLTALARCLGVRKREALELMEDYDVYTDWEADNRFNDVMDDIINDLILSEIPEAYRYYFDEDRYKRDVLISDGRGHIISAYDGEELEQRINGVYYYIYRQN